LLIAGIHAGSHQCAKVNMMWVDAIAKSHFQGHFEGRKNDLWSIAETLSIFMKPVHL